MTIGLFAPALDTQGRQLLAALRAVRPEGVKFFDLAIAETERTSMGVNAAPWNGQELGELDTALLCGFTYMDPIIPWAASHTDWSLWRFDYIAQAQKYTYLHSLFAELVRRGVKMLNPPDAHMRVFMKPFLLDLLARNGFRVPRFICANELDAVRAFCAEQQRVLWRPATGRAMYQLFTERQRDALISTRKPPVIVAEECPGVMVRAYVFEGRPLLALARFLPDCNNNEETLESFVEVAIAPFEADLKRLAEVLQLDWFEVSCVVGEDESLTICDLETDPLWEGLAVEHRDVLLERLARSVAGEKLVIPVPDKARELPRPTIFLRRMLQILFEFEESKYGKAKQPS